MNRNKRIEWIDKLKGYLILSVIFLHCFNGYTTSVFTTNFLKYITSFHMIAFFCLSGYLFDYNVTSIKDCIKRKTNTLLKPYLIWGILIGFIVENARLIIRFKDINLIENLFRIITLRESFLASWFLIVLFGIYLLEYLISLLKKWNISKFDMILLIIHVFLFVGGVLLNCAGIGDYFHISLILISSFFFYFGYLFKKLKNVNLVYSVIFIIVGAIFAFVNGTVKLSALITSNYLLFVLSGLLSSLGWIGFFMNIPDTANKRFKSAANYIMLFGRDSIIVLLTHPIVLYGFRFVEAFLKMEIHTFPVILAFPITVFIEYIIIKFMPTFMKKSFGK